MSYKNEEEYNEVQSAIEYDEALQSQYEKQARAEELELDYQNSHWTNGPYSIKWLHDQVVISGPYDRHCIMDGGDFEYALQALLATNPIKIEDLY